MECLQVYDIDLKLWNGNIEYLKQKMFEMLQEFHWFLWICKSASGKGIHIYTKVAAPHHVYTNLEDRTNISPNIGMQLIILRKYLISMIATSFTFDR